MRPASTRDARARLRLAQAYLEVAELVLDDGERIEMPSVAAGPAVLVGIAGSDAVCARRPGEFSRGDDHRWAGRLVARAAEEIER